MNQPSAGRTTVVMRHTSDDDGTMWRAVSLDGGRLVVEGHDLGEGVKRVFGCREYEFRRTLSGAETSTVRGLLGVTPEADLLAAVQDRFPSTYELERLLADHGITGEFWSRVGD